MTGWALVAMIKVVPIVQPEPAAPAGPVAIPVAPPLQPQWVQRAQALPGPTPDLEGLDRQFGAYYPEPKGRGLRIGGAAAVAFGTLQMFTALISLITAAGLYDSGEVDTARTLATIGAGCGISGVLHTGAGIPMLIVGRKRQQRYHDWLRGQPGGPPRMSLRPGAPGAGPVGLSLALRF